MVATTSTRALELINERARKLSDEDIRIVLTVVTTLLEIQENKKEA